MGGFGVGVVVASDVVVGLFWVFFGFEFCYKIWVSLWVWLGLGMGKIGANLRLETEMSEEWFEGEEQERRD